MLDFDGVIATLDIDWRNLRKQISKKFDLEIESLTKFFEENFGTQQFELVSQEVRVAELGAAQKAKPYSDVAPSLEYLAEHRIKTYLASMQSIEVVNSYLKRYGWGHYFLRVFGREQGGSKRVELETIKKEEKTGKLILVDDMKRNLSAARELGYNAILFRRPTKPSLLALVKSLVEQRPLEKR